MPYVIGAILLATYGNLAEAKVEHQVRQVALVLFEGFTVLDAYGPVQVFAAAFETPPAGPPKRLYHIFTVAEQVGPVRSGEGPVTMADYGFADMPACDILLIPGGMGTRPGVTRSELIGPLGTASSAAPVTATVCTGAALLARTGRLDGRAATSNKMAWQWVTEQSGAVRWVRRARWVDDGDIVSSSGVSAGIDMALALVARLHGRPVAERAAKVMEYIWHDDPADDPFA
jgi:transcriptional regulator GlxA family with amidase domain